VSGRRDARRPGGPQAAPGAAAEHGARSDGGAPSAADDRRPRLPWRPPTRRAFVAMIGAAAAALAVNHRTHLAPGGAPPEDERPRSTWTGATRWIGHC
jgi:hypothetical protein